MSRAPHWRLPRILRHRSFDHRRVEHNHREQAFAAAWETENAPTPARGLGRFGTLQALMFDQRGLANGALPWWRMPARLWITNRDAAIVATVMQWLGSNVGMDFLRRSLKACGYDIVPDTKWRSAPDCCPICHGRGRRAHIGGIDRCGWCLNPWRNLSEERITA